MIREKCGFSIKQLLQYSLGTIAWSLAKPEGNIFMFVKSKLQNALEEKINLVDSVPQNFARVFDGMCIIQQLASCLEIFGCLSDFILTHITNNSYSNIFFTMDQYWDTSIKSYERNQRATSGSIRVTASRRDQKLPKQFKKYLSVGVNKQELIDFLLLDWSTYPKHHQLIRNKTIYFTKRKDAFKLNVIEDTQC